MVFEKLDVWQRAVALSCAIYKELASVKDYGFKDQVTRSALSIASNIAEGEGRETLKDNIRFLYIARGSAAELITQLHIGLRVGFIEQSAGENLLKQTEVVVKQIHALIKAKRKMIGDGE